MRLRTRTAVMIALAVAMLPHLLLAVGGGNSKRYEVILRKKPFGEPPPPPVVAPPPGQVAPRGVDLARELKLVALTKNKYGVSVGVVDVKDKKDHFLRVGESEDNFKVLAADLEKRKAFVRKGLDEAWLAMDDPRTAQTAPVAGQPPAPGQPVSVSSAPIPGTRAPRKRPMVPRPQAVSEPKMTGEELEQHLRSYNMDVIRQGMPPLPIPLTDAEDDQLVSEGVLPPQGQ